MLMGTEPLLQHLTMTCPVAFLTPPSRGSLPPSLDTNLRNLSMKRSQEIRWWPVQVQERCKRPEPAHIQGKSYYHQWECNKRWGSERMTGVTADRRGQDLSRHQWWAPCSRGQIMNNFKSAPGWTSQNECWWPTSTLSWLCCFANSVGRCPNSLVFPLELPSENVTHSLNSLNVSKLPFEAINWKNIQLGQMIEMTHYHLPFVIFL